MLDNKVILITGGTGSFGKECTKILLKNYKPKKVIIFSRDELKQFEMAQTLAEYDCVRYFVGDVRDKERLYRAFDGVDVVIHAAALKQVPACEYNPIEAVKTNVYGAMNIIDVAIDQGVEKVIALSTDKATNPINLYGATKLCSDKLFVQGNAYVGSKKTRFSVVRYGNVVGSRGSVIPFFLKKKESGILPITDKRMTRFWITLDQGVQFVIDSLGRMHGGEVFVPKIPSMNIMEMARAICPDCKYEFVGIRPGEKLHEVLVPKDEANRTLEFENFFVIQPWLDFWRLEKTNHIDGKPCPEEFEYRSDSNGEWLNLEGLREMIGLAVTEK